MGIFPKDLLDEFTRIQSMDLSAGLQKSLDQGAENLRRLQESDPLWIASQKIPTMIPDFGQMAPPQQRFKASPFQDFNDQAMPQMAPGSPYQPLEGPPKPASPDFRLSEMDPLQSARPWSPEEERMLSQGPAEEVATGNGTALSGSGGGKSTVRQHSDLISEASARYGVPSSVIAGIMDIESGGKASAVSPAGALGLMQVMPFHFQEGEDGMDPRTNVLKGAKILADNYRRWGSWDKAAAAYFGAIDGEGNITGARDAVGQSGGGYVSAFNNAKQQYEDIPVGETSAGFYRGTNFNGDPGFRRDMGGEDIDPGFSRELYPNQMRTGELSYDEALAACGIVALVAFNRANGRNPSVTEAKEIAAQEGGWSAGSGMGGPAGWVKAAKAMGVQAHMEGVDWDKVKQDVMAGNPVTLSSPGSSGHYWVVQDYDPTSGKYKVGESGKVVGSSEWASPAEIQANKYGHVDTAIYLDNPSSEGLSYANKVADPDPREDPHQYADRLGSLLGDPPVKNSFNLKMLDKDPGENTQQRWDPIKAMQDTLSGIGIKIGETSKAATDALNSGAEAIGGALNTFGESLPDGRTALGLGEGGKGVPDVIKAAGRGEAVNPLDWAQETAYGATDVLQSAAPQGVQDVLNRSATAGLPGVPEIPVTGRDVAASTLDPSNLLPAEVLAEPVFNHVVKPIFNRTARPIMDALGDRAMPVVRDLADSLLRQARDQTGVFAPQPGVMTLPNPLAREAAPDPRRALWDAVVGKIERGEKPDIPVSKSVESGFREAAGLKQGKYTHITPDGEELKVGSPYELIRASQLDEAVTRTKQKMANGETLGPDDVLSWTRADPSWLLPYESRHAGNTLSERSFVPDLLVEHPDRVVLEEIKSNNFRGYQSNQTKEAEVGFTNLKETPLKDEQFAFPADVGQRGQFKDKPVSLRLMAEREISDAAGGPENLRSWLAPNHENLTKAEKTSIYSARNGLIREGKRDWLKGQSDEQIRTRLDDLMTQIDDMEGAEFPVIEKGKEKTRLPYSDTPRLAALKRERNEMLFQLEREGRLDLGGKSLPAITSLSDKATHPQFLGRPAYEAVPGALALEPEEDEEGNTRLGITKDPVRLALATAATPQGRQLLQKAFPKVEQVLKGQTPAALAAPPKDVSVGDWAKAISYNSLLSGPRTLMVNALGSAEVPFKLFKDTLKQSPETTVYEILGGLKSIDTGIANGLETLKYGMSSRQASAMGIPDMRLPGPAGAAVESPMRVLGGVDEVVHAILYGMENGRQASLEARKAGGLSLADRAALFDHMLAQPSQQASEAALSVANRLTYKGEMGTVGQKAEKIVDLLGPVGNAFMPFVRTPYHLAARGIDRSPIGLAGTVFDAVMEGMGNPTVLGKKLGASERNAPLDERFMEGILGTALTAWGVGQAIQGNLTGSGPDDVRERAKLERQGWQANSVKVGDKYLDYSQFGAFAIPLSLAAAMGESFIYKDKGKKPDEKNNMEGWSEIGRRFGQTFTEHGYLSGLGTLSDLLSGNQSGGQAAERFIAGNISRALPFSAAINTYAQSQDPSVRAPEGITERLQARMPQEAPGPGRMDLPPALDVYGREKPNQFYGTSALEPIRQQVRRPDPVDNELTRIETNVGPAPKEIGGVALSREQKQDFQKMSGANIYTALSVLMESNDYHGSTDDRKKSLVQSTVEDARKRAADLVVAPDERQVRDLGMPPKYEGIETAKDEKRIDAVIAKVTEWKKRARVENDPGPEPTDDEWDTYGNYRNAITQEYKDEVKRRLKETQKRKGLDLPYDSTPSREPTHVNGNPQYSSGESPPFYLYTGR